MTRILSVASVVVLMAVGAAGQSAPDAPELTKLLNEFLAGASRNDAAVHDRFWAEDLIYTGSAGRRIGKADVLRNARSGPAPGASPTPTYTAEDVRIQQYGDTAVVAFRLVATTGRDGNTEVSKYLNSGTFLKRNGKWQVVNWQSTRLPRDEAEAKQEAASVESAFHKALLAADLKKLESLTDEGFIWTHRNGDQVTRGQLLDQLRSGRLKYSKLETSNVTVSVHGDAAVVRGVSPRQRSSIPGAEGPGDPEPFNVFYTLTLVNRGGGWRAVAMHTSRP